jgi:hypothetical protein
MGIPASMDTFSLLFSLHRSHLTDYMHARLASRTHSLLPHHFLLHHPPRSLLSSKPHYFLIHHSIPRSHILAALLSNLVCFALWSRQPAVPLFCIWSWVIAVLYSAVLGRTVDYSILLFTRLFSQNFTQSYKPFKKILAAKSAARVTI